ncbi:MAG: hypothetical protein ACKOT0_03685 [bacterium]
MKITRRIVGVAAAAALVAAGGVATISPAYAYTMDGKTNVSLKKDTVALFANAGVTMKANPPAKRNGSKLMFPIQAFGYNYADMAGGLTLGGPSKATFVATNPEMSWRNKNGHIEFTTAIGRIDLFDLSHVNKNVQITFDKSHRQWIRKTTTVVTATMNLTKDQSVINYINNRLGTSIFKAGLGMGKLRTTVLETDVCKVNDERQCASQ